MESHRVPRTGSELEFRSFRPYSATVYYVDRENGARMITVDQMASEIRLGLSKKLRKAPRI